MPADTTVRERPILFSGRLVRAILDGRKTVTRRPVKPQPNLGPDGEMVHLGDGAWAASDGDLWGQWPSPYGVPGDRLWVRETWMPRSLGMGSPAFNAAQRPRYRADDGEDRPEWRGLWRPSIFMPRWASRLTLEVVSVRVERLQDITRAEVAAEGLGGMATVDDFHAGWDGLYCGKPEYRWDADPWVWVVEFRALVRKED